MQFDLNYISIGEGDPLVFQHGLGADINQTEALMAGLPGRRLISMDCRGHGRSSLPDDYTPSFNAYTDDLVRLLDKLGVEKAVFGGISMGSGISLNMALRYPDRVKGLILVRPAWLDKGEPENLRILVDVAKYINEPDGQALFERTEAFQYIRTALPAAAASVLGQFSQNKGAASTRILTNMFRDSPFKAMSDLAKIDQPALVIANHDDPLHPFELAVEMDKALPNSEMHEVVSRYVDDPEHRRTVRALVTDFLARL